MADTETKEALDKFGRTIAQDVRKKALGEVHTVLDRLQFELGLEVGADNDPVAAVRGAVRETLWRLEQRMEDLDHADWMEGLDHAD